MKLPAKERLISMLQAYVSDPDYHGWDAQLVRDDYTFVTVDDEVGATAIEAEIKPYMCNGAGNLHGGAAATIMDNLTSTALMVLSRPGKMEYGTVTRNLAVTILRPVKMGTRVRIESEVVSVGKTLANVQGWIKTLDGKVCVTCSHDKAIVSGPKL